MEGTIPSIMDISVSNSTEQTESTTVNVFMQDVNNMVIFKIANFIAKCWVPILVPIGLIGNTLSFLVMIKPNNRKLSTCIYMAAISINDNFMMVLAFYSAWLANALKLYIMSDLECKTAAFFVLFGLQNSTFQVIAMTFDKYIAIKWPHRAATYSTPRRAKMTIAGVTACVVIYNIPHLFLSKMVGDVCIGYSIGGVITNVYSWLTFSINGVLAFAMLIFMNYVIIKKVRGSRKMFGGNEGQGKGQGQNNVTSSRREQKLKNTENQLTTMLLLVTTLFLILLFPTNVRFVYSNFVARDIPTKYASVIFFYHLSHKLYFTNNGINFFLYCISGQKFRNDLKEILGCG